jgi:hypothetical protein
MLRSMLPQPRPPPLRLTNLHEFSDVAVIKVRFEQSERFVFAYTIMKVLVAYRLEDGSVKTSWASGEKIDLKRAVAIYAECCGWKQDISSVRLFTDLPEACKTFIKT